MASWNRRTLVEDIPLIDNPTPLLTARTIHTPHSIRRKPLPTRQDELSYISRKQIPNRVGYSTVSEVEEEVYEHDPARGVPTKSAQALDQAEKAIWLPYALRWPWLLGIIGFGVLLLLLVIALHYESSRHNGLTKDTGNPGLDFAWRFMPTLLAVTYVTMLMVILDATKRTEAFARLTSTSGATAESSISRKPGAWWTALADSFPRKQNGRRFSTAMLCAVIAYILGLFVISPFSSALLEVRDISITQVVEFGTIKLEDSLPLSIQIDTLDFAQTMAHSLQNVTTSPWIMGAYNIVPFWPSQEGRPSGAQITSYGSWQASTTILKSEIECEDLVLVANTTHMNFTSSNDFGYGTIFISGNYTSYVFSTQSGCEYGLAYQTYGYGPSPDVGGLYWSNLSNVNFDSYGYPDVGNGDQSTLLNHTRLCEPGEVIIVVPASNSSTLPFGYLLRTKYYRATLPVTMIPNSGATMFEFDEDMFNQTRRLVTADFINTSAIDNTFLSSIWNSFLVDPLGQNDANRASAGGPAKILASLYEFQMPPLIDDPNLSTIAIQIQQQFFGRVTQSALQNITNTNNLKGSVLTSERRIVVTVFVAIILEVVLFASICLLLVFTWHTRLVNRPLGVAQDPAFVNTIAALIPTTRDLTALLNATAKIDVPYTEQERHAVICRLVNHKLETIFQHGTRHSDASGKTYNRPTSWSSSLLTGWVIFLLVVFLCILIASITTLYWYSIVHGLSQRAFTYQMTVESDGHFFGKITPYSIFPTLLGVLTSLWWGAIDGVFRNVQPFIAMTRRPTISGRGSGLSYQSSYLAWASVRSLTRRHWLLALVCTGAFFSQIFTISMSALWQPVPSYQNSTLIVNQPFQLREVPRLYVASSYHTTPSQTILPNVFKNFTSNWLYGAFSQLTVNASQPAWSLDGWSFVPVSLSDLGLSQQGTSEQNVTNVLATITVPAIRGRLECVPLAPNLDTKYYTSRANMSLYNATARPLPPSDAYYLLGCSGPTASSPKRRINFDPNTTALNDNCSFMQSSASLLTADVPVTCCGWDENGSPDNAIFSYWSPIFGQNDSSSVPQGFDFVVKTLYGPSPASYSGGGSSQSLLWRTPPSLAMVNCTPIIETASSDVTIHALTGQVKSYTIHGEATPYTPAWTNNYLQHQVPPGAEYSFYAANYTVSFGPLFMSALLGAAQLNLLGGCGDESGISCHEWSDDQTFNYHAPGINMDYMSYSMFTLASKNASAMLDHTQMISLAQTVFTTFFQHFASSNVPMNGTGGWVYQKASETLPQDLLPPNVGINSQVAQSAPATITATVSQPIEKLQMSPVAVYLCLTILFWLLVTTLLIWVSKKRYFSPLLQPTETILDVVRLVAYSDCYLELAREKGATGLSHDKFFRTKLGWFRSRRDGQVKWGIELADDPRVDWLDDEEVKWLQRVKGS